MCTSNGKSVHKKYWFCNRPLTPTCQMSDSDDRHLQDTTVSTSDLKKTSNLQLLDVNHIETGVHSQINENEDICSNKEVVTDTTSESEIDDEDRDKNFDVKKLLFDGEELSDVNDSEEYESEKIERQDDIEFYDTSNKNKIDAYDYSDKEILDKEADVQQNSNKNKLPVKSQIQVNETLADKLKYEKNPKTNINKTRIL